MPATSSTLLLVLTLVAAAATGADAQCKAGDNCCWCRRAGGTCQTFRAPLLPTCTLRIQHQGSARKVNVYLPNNYNPSRAYPMWVQLHGNFWATMGGINTQVGFNPDAAEVTPVWDKTAGTSLAANTILVYPQSSGWPTQKQFWNTIFWRCSNGVCIDSGVDDVGFLDQVLTQLPNRFRAKDVYLSGTSAGGMMVYTMLCRSRAMRAGRVRAAAVVIGGMGKSFADGCTSPARVPLMILHGAKDEHIPYNRPVVLDYVPFMSTADVGRFWVGRQGLARSTSFTWNNPQMRCTVYSSSRATAVRAPAGGTEVQLCEVWNTGHSTDQPWPGYMFGQARNFFTRHS